MQKTLFQTFKKSIAGIPLPEKFTFPFYYEPHPLCIIAAEELQNYLKSQTDFEHNFGIDDTQQGLIIGKMFGVLVVQNQQEDLGYLWAFSGKLAESNQLPFFVPTVYDMLKHDGFFKKEEISINQLNAEIENLEQSPDYLNSINNLQKTKQQSEKEIFEQKIKIKEGKKARAELRKNPTTEIDQDALNKASQEEGILLKKMTQYWHYKIEEATQAIVPFTTRINQLKEERRQKSAALQQQLFKEYAFLNKHQELKSLSEIFNGNPPAGAGECAAPKLLHYAFQHDLKPIAMAEFWWGQSPKSEVRKHGQFYPACTGKCEPILNHMLQDIVLEDNPFKTNSAEGKKIEIVFEDDYLALVNKPTEFLSVPGKQVTDSVYTRMKLKYPNATGPLVVHRLDMSTSGLLLIAKTSEIYKKLQSQFIKRQIQKRYVALLDGILTNDEGIIDLPLRVDLDNRPNQIVCFEYGKPAQTRWEVIERRANQTLVYFYPITGRTHQLRVHAAHKFGLNTPIVGDDLYGTKAHRLHLHAERLTFEHPVSKEKITIVKDAEF
ncbi:RluA family pseudouridine synthase [Flavobacterium silvisoli]|uniref:RluA family pseudouridine synthase n=1 Tax=Flavobacterium silvisoli TaxID=2529433 RepID=A0A4Q9Z065_9FLAO|nr:RluA family pseudouridine synthase [Flavobacterium silvisoli]TBX67049.1 RluA family pseudouridine synthase [Flavobacterium silvisoli]